MAVGLERVHAQCLGQGQGLLIVGLGLHALSRLTPCRNVAEEAQGIRLVAPFLMRTGKYQRALSACIRFLQAASQSMCFTQGEAAERLKARHVPCHGLFHRLRQQRDGVGNAPRQGIPCTQHRRHSGEKDRQVLFLTDTQSPFEPGEGPAQVTLAAGE